MPRLGTAAILLFCATPSVAQPQTEASGPLQLGLEFAPLSQPDSDAAAAAEPPTASEDATAAPVLTLFGDPGSDWLTLSLGVADDFDESTDFNLSLAWSRFVVRNVEFGVDAGVWYFDQERDAAVGLNGTLFLRWHFVARPTWSLFTDGGMGLLVCSDDVPDEGTSFNFTPRAGFGATFRLAPDDTRLEVGVRWMHISNARLTGNEANPGRDEPMVYVGVIFPF